MDVRVLQMPWSPLSIWPGEQGKNGQEEPKALILELPLLQQVMLDVGISQHWVVKLELMLMQNGVRSAVMDYLIAMTNHSEVGKNVIFEWLTMDFILKTLW